VTKDLNTGLPSTDTVLLTRVYVVRRPLEILNLGMYCAIYGGRVDFGITTGYVRFSLLHGDPP
jgi:hypothetical protein